MSVLSPTTNTLFQQNLGSYEKRSVPFVLQPSLLGNSRDCGKQSESTRDKGCPSNILSLPSNATEDFIAFSDIPFNRIEVNAIKANTDIQMKEVEANSAKTDFIGKVITGRVNQLNLIVAKPEGSAYISVRMSIGTDPLYKLLIPTSV